MDIKLHNVARGNKNLGGGGDANISPTYKQYIQYNNIIYIQNVYII